MSVCELSIPGKTFLAGEYVALAGGPALVLATEPRFRLNISEVQNKKKSDEFPFHPDSPAGLYFKKHENDFEKYHFEFFDPYQIGGFGASSAQFALLHTFHQLKADAFRESERFFDWHLLLKNYREMVPAGQKPPSGADIVGASSGKLTWFHRNTGQLQAFSWPFMEHEFFLVHTGNKISTHQHLNELDFSKIEGLEELMPPIHEALRTVDFPKMIEALNVWKKALFDRGLTSEKTLQILTKIEQEKEVIFAKGCGALGSDVLFVVCEKYFSERIRHFLMDLNLKVVADSSQISSGLQIRNFHHQEISI